MFRQFTRLVSVIPSGSLMLGSSVSGGVAALNHRLIALMPSGSFLRYWISGEASFNGPGDISPKRQRVSFAK